MKWHIISLVFSLFIGSISQAQQVKLSGKVWNDKNEPIAGVTVKTPGGAGTSTNVDGQYE